MHVQFSLGDWNTGHASADMDRETSENHLATALFGYTRIQFNLYIQHIWIDVDTSATKQSLPQWMAAKHSMV